MRGGGHASGEFLENQRLEWDKVWAQDDHAGWTRPTDGSLSTPDSGRGEGVLRRNGQQHRETGLEYVLRLRVVLRGLRVLVDYDEAQAIRHYRMLHLEAGEAAVREELSREITRRRAAIQDFVDTEPSTWALGDLGNSR